VHNLSAALSAALFSSTSRSLFPPPLPSSPPASRAISSVWSGAMVLEPGGSFLFLGGGYDFSAAASSTATISSSRSAGWLAALYLGGGDQAIVTSSTHTPHPIQAMCFHGPDLITGGPVSGLRYFNISPLGAPFLLLSPHPLLDPLPQRRYPQLPPAPLQSRSSSPSPLLAPRLRASSLRGVPLLSLTSTP
jgi:hypothetical protein